MDSATFSTYLEKRYVDQLNYYNDKSGKNQKKYKFFQWALIILSTLTTILAALPKADQYWIQYIVIFSAALVTIITSALKTFQYQELWVTYRTTIEQLKPEIYYYTFNVGDYGQNGVDKETLFVTRVEGILGKEHDAWPVYKHLMNAAGKQENEALQHKLDQLIREKMNTVKNPADVQSPVNEVDMPNDEPVEPPAGQPAETPQADDVINEPNDSDQLTGDNRNV